VSKYVGYTCCCTYSSSGYFHLIHETNLESGVFIIDGRIIYKERNYIAHLNVLLRRTLVAVPLSNELVIAIQFESLTRSPASDVEAVRGHSTCLFHLEAVPIIVAVMSTISVPCRVGNEAVALDDSLLGGSRLHAVGADAEASVFVTVVRIENEAIAILDGVVDRAGRAPPHDFDAIPKEDKMVKSSIYVRSEIPDVCVVTVESAIGGDFVNPSTQGIINA